jgi:hypothetical protein
MLAAIGLSTHRRGCIPSVYITNMLPWRPPQNRDPTPEEISMLQPFVRRHVELAAPEVLILMGNWACRPSGQARHHPAARHMGGGAGPPRAADVPPAYLLRNPAAKRRGLGRSPVAAGETRGETMSRIDESRPFHPVRIAVLAVSDTRSLAEDTSGAVLVERLTEAGHTLAARHILPDERDQIADQLRAWVADPGIDVIITTGAPA